MAGIKQKPKTRKRAHTHRKKSPRAAADKGPVKLVLKPYKRRAPKKEDYYEAPIVPLATARANCRRIAEKVVGEHLENKREVLLKDDLDMWEYVDADVDQDEYDWDCESDSDQSDVE